MGFRGASRYYSPRYRQGFALECRAIRRLRKEMGFSKVVVMIPSCSSVAEADRVPEIMAENGLTQLTLGVDRDSAELAGLFDEQDAAVKWMIRNVIGEAHKAGAKVGLCGQASSDHPEFAAFLVECGIDSISVSPDGFVAVKKAVAEAEHAKSRRH